MEVSDKESRNNLHESNVSVLQSPACSSTGKYDSMDSNFGHDNDRAGGGDIGQESDGSQLLYQLHSSIDFGPGLEETSMFEDLLTDDSTLNTSSAMNYSKIEPRITEFKEAIIKRDNIIKQLVDSHEILQQQLEETKEQLRQTEPLTDELEKVKDSLQALVEKSLQGNQSLLAEPIGDTSSYLNLPGLTNPQQSRVVISSADANVGTDDFEREVVSPVAAPNCTGCREVEEFKLQVIDLDKKLDARNKYLEEITMEREHERDEYHREIEKRDLRIEDLRRENEKLQDNVLHQKIELDDFEIRLKDADEVEQELVCKCQKAEEELHSAVDKIYELREIIRDLEQQIDAASNNASEVRQQNQILTEELERLEEKLRDHEEVMQTTQDTITSSGQSAEIEEIQTQITDLSSRIEKKLTELDNFPWSTRPNSSCSEAQYLSTEDVSVKELSNNMSRTLQAATPFLIAEGLCRLEAHFESLMRFEEIIMKKLKDNEIRYGLSKKRQGELENEKVALQETMKEQLMKISDLQSRLDQFRFEPSPNAVTLTGLRTRVQFLSEQVEEYKGQLQLKIIENQDTEHKLAQTQALLAKFSSQSLSVRKSNALVQTDSDLQRGSFLRKKTKEASVQVSPKENIFNENNFDTLDFSAIHGDPPPVHSTPNEPDAPRRKTPASFTSLFDSEKVPEEMRFQESERLQFSSTIDSNKPYETEKITTIDLPSKQVRFEASPPPPDSILVNELRSKIRILSVEIENYKIQLQLRSTENQEVEHKLADAQALISKYEAHLRIYQTKVSAITQTENIKPNTYSSAVQTEPIVISQQASRKTTNAFVQTQEQIKSQRTSIVQTETESSVTSSASSAQTDPVTIISRPVKVKEAIVQTLPITTAAPPTPTIARKPLVSIQVQTTEVQSTNTSAQTDAQLTLTQPSQSSSIQRKDPKPKPVDEIESFNAFNSAKKPLSWASVELYLRTKSHRKALCWQKKYLTIVIHGYKDLLCMSGAGFEHPDLLQKELSIVPTAVGLADTSSPLTRFRIVAKAIIATARMKYMVRRWRGKLRHSNSRLSSCSKENSPPLTPCQEKSMPVIAAGFGLNKSDHRNVLTQYLERFQHLENEIGQTIGSRTRTLPK